jgi:mRNA interferase MazF
MPTAWPKTGARRRSHRKLAPFGLIWVAMITSAENAPWVYDVTIANLARAGLPAPSVVRTAKIASIEPVRIEGRAGRLDKATAKAVAQKLKGFLGNA